MKESLRYARDISSCNLYFSRISGLLKQILLVKGDGEWKGRKER